MKHNDWCMTIIERACVHDTDELVGLEGLLRAEDAGRHERFADVTWPQREERRDFERLLADRPCIVIADFRRTGVARLTTERFLEWARNIGCVDSYVADQPAQHLYEPLGFVSLSVSRVLTL